MKIMKNLFGARLFDFVKPPKPPEMMYDFAQHGILNVSSNRYNLADYVEEVPPEDEGKLEKKKKPVKPTIQPKALHEAQGLHDKKFTLNVDPDYITEQLDFINGKLDFLGKKPRKGKNESIFDGEWGRVKYTREELESFKERLENRRKIESVTTILAKYPYTTTDKIREVVDAHSNLECEKAVGYIADFPKDADKAMKEYNDMCMKLCGKKSMFYILIEKEDTKTVNARRDPILLAQSPFGFFWQILGAWDKEMVYLADL